MTGGVGKRVTARKAKDGPAPKRRVTKHIRQREIDKAEAVIEAKFERIKNGGQRVELDEATGIATMYKLMPKRNTNPVEAATEAVEWYENRGWTDISVQGRATENGRNYHIVLNGTPPAVEEEIVPMRDHDGAIIYMKVEHRFESAIGPAIRGFAYSDPAVLNKQYLGQRILPESSVYDKAAEEEARKNVRASARASRRAGGGHCHHCGEATKGGRFIPGHDAKLKGDLIREATTEAEAERIIRRWTHEPEKMASKLAALVARGDEFIEERVMERTGLSREELF